MDNWYDKLHFDPSGIIIELGIMNNWAESGGLSVRNTNKIRKLCKTTFFDIYNNSPPNFTILLILIRCFRIIRPDQNLVCHRNCPLNLTVRNIALNLV